MGIIDKAEARVIKHTPHVILALGRIKFFLIIIPIISVVIGIMSQFLFPERNIATCSFKIGSFATPANPIPVPLASETQLKARLRATSIQLREEYPTFLMIGTIIDGDVVTPTVSGVGPEKSIDFLEKVIEPEINLHNGRLEKLQAVQADRRESLEPGPGYGYGCFLPPVRRPGNPGTDLDTDLFNGQRADEPVPCLQSRSDGKRGGGRRPGLCSQHGPVQLPGADGC